MFSCMFFEMTNTCNFPCSISLSSIRHENSKILSDCIQLQYRKKVSQNSSLYIAFWSVAGKAVFFFVLGAELRTGEGLFSVLSQCRNQIPEIQEITYYYVIYYMISHLAKSRIMRACFKDQSQPSSLHRLRDTDVFQLSDMLLLSSIGTYEQVL